MNKLFKLIMSVAVMSAACSCGDYKLRKQLKEFENSIIEIPEDLEVVFDRKVSMSAHFDGKPVLVFFHDSLECGSCRINHLLDNLPLHEMSDSLGSFDVMVVFSPRHDEYDEIVRQLVIRDFPFPVYLDSFGSFSSLNSCIPADKRFHSFLIDSGCHPVYVGNPMSGDRMFELFVRVIDML